MKQCSTCGAEYPDHATVCATDYTPLGLPAAPSEKPHSGIGIASFIMSIASGVLIGAAIVAAGALSTHRTPGSTTYPGQTLVGLAILFFLGADVIAVGLGIASICQTGKNRLFGILGLVFSGLTILGTIGLIIVGLMFASARQ